MNKKLFFVALIVAIFPVVHGSNSIPVDAPVTTELAGKSATTATSAVVRILDVQTGTAGTGFLHKSGRVITAAHVVKNPNVASLKIILSSGNVIDVKSCAREPDIDVAVLEPAVPIVGIPLKIKKTASIPVGTQVSTWGFPSGYSSLAPLLTVGYVSGVDSLKTDSGKIVQRFVINAAFNGGNSGGPILEVEDGTVIGVVSSKLAPIPPYIESALVALQNQNSGMMYEATDSNGKPVSLTEGKIIGDVLTYLRSQTQLVIGYAVPSSQLSDFLKGQNIEP